MDVNDVLTVSREAMWVTLKLAGPMMIVGLVIALVRMRSKSSEDMKE